MLYVKKFLKNLLIFSLCFLLSACPNTEPQVIDKEPDTQEIDNQVYAVPIIMYHRVFTKKLGDYCVSPNQFEEDLQYINDCGFTTITINELIAFSENNFSMPKNPIVLTFDDCHYDNYTQVLPLLKKHNAKATFYIIGAFSERFSFGQNQVEGSSHLSYQNISDMASSGHCDIANHTYDLHDWTRGRFGVGKVENESFEDYKHILNQDITKTNEILAGLNIASRSFAYPFGVYNADAERIILDMGFKALVTTDGGINRISKTSCDCLKQLKRYNRPHSASTQEFFDNIFSLI